MAHPRIKFSNMVNVSAKAVASLEAAGFTRLEHLRGKSITDLTDIKGIGKETAATLLTELAQMNPAD